MKRLMSLGMSLVLVASHVSPVMAANEGWQESNGTWRYVKEDGSLATGWLKDGYSWYYMDENGVMTTSTWVGSHEHWYWIGAGGVMQESTVIEYNGERYYLKGTGVMARDYVKDGWEYDENGVGKPLSSSDSVVISSAADLEGINTVEGNLYISEEVTEDIDLSNIDIQGKLVILKEDITVTVDDVTANGLSIQGINSEVVLAGTTEVGTVEIERGSTLSADRSFDGKVEEIKVQSSVTEPTEISVEADKVETRTFSEVTLNEPVGEVTVVANNKITVNADVEEIQVLSSAPETVIEVTRGNKVETITADAPTSVEGNGTVGLIEANIDGTTADEDVTVEDVDKGTGVEDAPEATKPSRPSNGGGNYVPPVTYYTVTYTNTEGTVLGTSVVSSGSTVTNVPVETPSAGNKISWFNGSKLFDIENDRVRSNITLVAVEGSDDFTAGNGSETYPYMISSADELSKINNTNSNYLLLQDIEVNLNDSKRYGQLVYFISDASGVLDGNGNTIYVTCENGARQSRWNYFIYRSRGLNIENINFVNRNSNNFAIIGFALSDTVLDGVTYDALSTQEVDGNCAVFVYTVALLNSDDTLLLNNCTNNADLGGTSYNAVFIGWVNGDTVQGATVEITNSINNGNLYCEKAALFIGNSSNHDRFTFKASNNANSGIIRGTQRINYGIVLASGNPTDTFKAINQTAYNSLVNVGTFKLDYEDTSLAISVNGEDVTVTKAANEQIVKYVVKLGMYTNIATGGTMRLYVTEEFDSSGFTSNQYTSKLQYIGFTDNAGTTRDELGYDIYESEGKKYYSFNKYNQDGYYVGSPVEPGTVEKPTLVTVEGYSEDGILISSASLSN